MTDLQWHFKNHSIAFTEEEKGTYLSSVQTLLHYIEDDLILSARQITREHKLYAFRLKYGDCISAKLHPDDICIYAGETLVTAMSETVLNLELYENKENSCILEGSLNILPVFSKDLKLFVKAGDTCVEAASYGTRPPLLHLDQEMLSFITFKADILLKADQPNILEFYCESNGIRIPLTSISYKNHFPVSAKYKNSYFIHNGWVLTCWENGIVLKQQKTGDYLKHDFALNKELWNTGHMYCRKAVFSSIFANILKVFKRKPLWLISDRASKAGDNGEAFFRFVIEHHPEIDARFVINGDCPDYIAMKQVGPVVKKDSAQHKLLHLLCDCIISSHGEADVANPLFRSHAAYRHLLGNTKFIFLQHGIIMNDLSGWLARYKKNIKGFVTTAFPEYDSILHGAYEYRPEDIWLTGLPRFDRLYEDSQKWITIMPTWRKYLTKKIDLHTGKWALAEDIEKSDYVQFFNQLLSSKRLHMAAQKYGYQIKFWPHPNMQTHLEVFSQNEFVSFLDPNTQYRDVYAKSDLVITDYSSAVFDFAYLRKPVLYAQFDADMFFSGAHTSTRGYFDYERDGFGEVTYDLESTIDLIIEYMENGCQIKEKYRERTDRFFAFNDHNNCQRVFDHIMKL